MAAEVLYLEDDLAMGELVRRAFARAGVDAHLTVASSRESFQRKFAEGADLILSDHDVPGFTGRQALAELRDAELKTPFIFFCRDGSRERVEECMVAGADDFVPKDEVWKLPLVSQRLLDQAERRRREEALARHQHGLKLLVNAVKALSMARSLGDIAAIVRKTARALNGADGATFVLRDGEKCFYFDEDAIAPLWKGMRFPLESCISGWAMLNKEHAAIPDIYKDARIPADAYRPTFVKSLVMVPVRKEAPVAAIGNYWAAPHTATADEIELIQALADSTSVAMENVRVYAELEQRVKDRTAALEAANVELAAANGELDAFARSVSHDLRNPVGQMKGFLDLLREELPEPTRRQQEYMSFIGLSADQMSELIEALLRLARTSRAEVVRTQVDLAAMAREIAARPSQDPAAPQREVQWRVADHLDAVGDEQLLHAVMENLISNAVKYSSKREAPVVEIGTRGVEGGRQIFFVRDNGAGFDPRYASRLFTAFGRLHPAEQFPGTGVGLATCQRIVQRHGGRLWAESAPDAGATFFFSLPLARA